MRSGSLIKLGGRHVWPSGDIIEPRKQTLYNQGPESHIKILKFDEMEIRLISWLSNRHKCRSEQG